MRHALGGKRVRPVLCLATGDAVGVAGREPAAGRRRGRARALVLARPRRPAVARRRPRAPWRAVGVGAVRRGDGDPRRRRAARRGDAARAHVSDRRRRARARRRDARDDRRPAARSRRRRASSTQLHSLKTGALFSASVDVRALGGRGAARRAPAVARVRRRARPAVPDRRRPARRRRLRARGRRGRCAPPRGRGGRARARAARRDRRGHRRARRDRRRARRSHAHETGRQARGARRARLPPRLLVDDDLGDR